MPVANIFALRTVKCSSVLLLILVISFTYFFKYQMKSTYYLSFETKSNHLAVETVAWNVNGSAKTSKEAIFSTDSSFRGHVIPLENGKYNTITLNCSSPTGERDTSCLVKDISIFNISGAKLFNFGAENMFSNEMTIPVNVILNGDIPLQIQIRQFLLHLLPVYLILLIFFTMGYKRAMPFAIAFGAMFVYAMLVFSNVNTGMDAIENINVANYFFSNPHYYSYVEYRGYMWFLLLWIVSFTANLFHIDFYYCYTVYGCLIYTILLNYLLPNFAKNMGIVKISYRNVILLGISLIILYGKQFFCPLPDIMPIFFLLLGSNLLLSKQLNWRLVFFAGICVAISCLIRANYYLSVLFIVLFLIFSWPRRYFTIIAFLIPILFLSISNKIFTSSLPIKISKTNLTQEILFKGMQVQKTSPYEIKDKMGIRILEAEQLKSSRQLTITKYFGLIKKYPIDFLTLYSIRVFNGLDIKYSQVYVSENGSRRMFSIINYILLFLGLYYLYNSFCYRAKWQKILCLFALVTPCLAMAVSFTETRYFLPLSLVLVSLGTLFIKRKLLKNNGFIFGLIVFIVCCLTVSASVYNQIL